MSLIMPLKRRVFHQALFFEFDVLCEWRVCSRLSASLPVVTLRRDFHDLFERFDELGLRFARPWFSVGGTVRISGAGDVILIVSSYRVQRAVLLDRFCESMSKVRGAER